MDTRKQKTVSPGASVSNEPIDPTSDELLKNAHLRLWMFPFPDDTPDADEDKGLFSSRNGKLLALALILIVIAWYTRVIIVAST